MESNRQIIIPYALLVNFITWTSTPANTSDTLKSLFITFTPYQFLKVVSGSQPLKLNTPITLVFISL